MAVATAVRPALVRCSDITVVHGAGEAAVRALAGVDFEVREGEHVGLLGPSGSGKTTLLHVIGGLVPPSTGIVAWRGEELAGLDQAARRQGPVNGIAYVFQGSNLLPNLDAEENIAFAILTAQRRGQARRRADETGPEPPRRRRTI